MGINDKVAILKGVGQKKAQALEKLKIHTVEDFLYYYPRNYEDRRFIKSINSLIDGETALIRGKIMLIVKGGYSYSKKHTLKLLVADDTGGIEIIFFQAKYLEKTLNKEMIYEFYGRVTAHADRLQMVHPDIIKCEDFTPGILPIYSLTQGISQGEMRKWQKEAQAYIGELSDYLPRDIIQRNRLCSLVYAIENIHFAVDDQRIKEAKFRLVFDELFLLQIGILSIRNRFNQLSDGISFDRLISMIDFTRNLPFELTVAQRRVLGEIERDMESKKVMNRLVQGDVGSGKTAIAATAMYKAIKCGYQAVMMAPTELLARQHYNSLKGLFEPFAIKVGLLTGSMRQKERQQILTALKLGEIDLLIGTHAVIQPNVEFAKLGLVITDEQHRFGVNQRLLLSQKGRNPDILVMTATPIPRTLAVTLYGDLDLSAIDEMPPGRKPVITKTVTETGRVAAYEFLREQIKSGRQAYIVSPLIEESFALDAKSATQLYEELYAKFKGYEVQLLHGALKQSEKDQIMEDYYSSKIDILVSTVVIEVGINVPNASIMLVENAERFGLATLHQLRGRVGRGEYQSYCILVTEGKTEMAKERAKIMQETNDGFIIAEKDLELRGPGEFFGIRQHGVPEFRIADLAKHIRILETARNEAVTILEKDPKLLSKEHQALKIKVLKTFENLETIGI